MEHFQVNVEEVGSLTVLQIADILAYSFTLVIYKLFACFLQTVSQTAEGVVVSYRKRL